MQEREGRIIDALELVRLPQPQQFLDRYPHQLSGGQLQRVVMARALILQPEFVVADEPVSMLDVSVRAGVLNVFRDVRDRLGLTAIYISHDLALVRYVCERTIVMYLGRIMEDGPTEDIVHEPLHPYTRRWSPPCRSRIRTRATTRCRSAVARRTRAIRPRAACSATAALMRSTAVPSRCPSCARPAPATSPAISFEALATGSGTHRCAPPSIHGPGPQEMFSRSASSRLPRPAAGEVLVRVRASGINPADVKRRAGWRGLTMGHSLVIPHTDGAGGSSRPALASIAPGSDNACGCGTRRAATARPAAPSAPQPNSSPSRRPGGAACRRAVLRGRRLPWRAGDDRVAQSTRDGPVEGQTLLVNGAAGAVGQFAVQMAAAGGARVIGTVSNRRRPRMPGPRRSGDHRPQARRCGRSRVWS